MKKPYFEGTQMLRLVLVVLAGVAVFGCSKFNPAGSLQPFVLRQILNCPAVPPNASPITVTTTSGSITASWTVPACAATSIVRRKTGSAPTSTSDGTAISSALGGFTDTSVLAGTIYYYKVYMVDTFLVPSTGTTISAIPGSTTVNPPMVADNSIVIDGSDSDSAWSSSPVFSFSFAEGFAESAGSQAQKAGYVKLAYDTNYFYIFVNSSDKYIYVDDAGAPWTDDGIEIFFDMNFDRAGAPKTDDFHFIFTPNAAAANNWLGKGTGAGWTTVWGPPAIAKVIQVNGTMNNNGDTDTGWTMEMKIPFSDLGVTSITSGQAIGFTFWLNVDDTVAHAVQHYYPYTTGTGSSNPSTWGICQF